MWALFHILPKGCCFSCQGWCEFSLLECLLCQNLSSAIGRQKQMRTVFPPKYCKPGLKPFFFYHLLRAEPRRHDGGHDNRNSLLLQEEMLCVLRSPACVHRDCDDFSPFNNLAHALWSQLKNTPVSSCERASNNITALECFSTER